MSAGEPVELVYFERPWTTDDDRLMSPVQRAAFVDEWTSAFKLISRVKRRDPLVGPVRVVVTPRVTRRAGRRTGDVAPAAEAALEGVLEHGLVPYGVVDVVEIVFRQPVLADEDALVLVLEPVDVEDER